MKAAEVLTSFFGDGLTSSSETSTRWADINTRLQRLDADGSTEKLIEVGRPTTWRAGVAYTRGEVP